jgi:hypothetical protein
MKKIDEAIENYFAPKETKPFGMTELVKLINEEIVALEGKVNVEFEEPLEEDMADVTSGDARKFLLSLPKFSPSEAWGNPDSMEREGIAPFMKRVTPYGKPSTSIAGIQEYLNYLLRIFSEENKITSPGRIISSLIVMESLSSVLNSFGDASAGFVFEGWLAALLAGKQEGKRSEKGNLPIQDIYAFTSPDFPGIPVSLKLLTKGSTDIHGSYTNLVDAINEFPDTGVPYFVALKTGEQIEVHVFSITRDNIVDVFAVRNAHLLAQVKGSPHSKLKGSKLVDLYKSLPWEERYEALQFSAGYSEKIRSKRAVARIDIEDMPPEARAAYERVRGKDLSMTEYKKQLCESDGVEHLHEAKSGGSQWHLTQKDMSRYAELLKVQAYANPIATIPMTPDSLEKAAAHHMTQLDKEIMILFSECKNLSDNLNKYFLQPKRANAIKNGDKAARNAKAVEEAASGMVEEEKAERSK